MQSQTEAEKPKAEKAKLSRADKIQKKFGEICDLVVAESEKDSKSENHQILHSVSKGAIKAFEAGKEADWNKVGNDLALFSRTQEPTADEAKKVLAALSLLYLKLEKDARIANPEKDSEKGE